jgi:hypothetical protein
VLAEFGLAGMVAVFVVLAWICRRFVRWSRASARLQDPVRFVALPVAVAFGVSLFYSHGWYTDITWFVPFLVLAYSLRLDVLAKTQARASV